MTIETSATLPRYPNGPMLPHRIRLRGPWNVVPLRDGESPRVARFPVRWAEIGLGDFTGPIRHLRRFGLPSKLDSHERAWLVAEGVEGSLRMQLNDTSLGEWPAGTPRVERDVTDLLRDRNELCVEVVADGMADGLGGEIALEIRGLAWLSDLSAWRQGDALVVTGRVRGPSHPRPDLYVILDRSPVLHTTLEPSPGGSDFELMSRPVPQQHWPPAVRVELVNGSVVWHGADVPLTPR